MIRAVRATFPLTFLLALGLLSTGCFTNVPASRPASDDGQEDDSTEINLTGAWHGNRLWEDGAGWYLLRTVELDLVQELDNVEGIATSEVLESDHDAFPLGDEDWGTVTGRVVGDLFHWETLWHRWGADYGTALISEDGTLTEDHVLDDGHFFMEVWPQ